MPQAKEALEKSASSATPLVDRSEEGLRVVEALSGVRGQIAVLHGRSRSGKSEFVRKWVIPALPKGVNAYYGKCDADLPATLEGPGGPVALNEAVRDGNGFLFLDSFDRLLTTASVSRRQALAPVFTDRAATLVLIASDRSLGDLLALRSIEPTIMDHLIETGEMSLGEGLENVEAPEDGQRLSYGPELLAAIEADLETFSPGRRAMTPDLVVLIDAHFRDVASGEAGDVDIRHFEIIGRLRGILETYVERRLGTAPADLQANDCIVLRAMLEEVVGARSGQRDFDGAEPARRLAIDPARCDAALQWLKSQGLVREGRPGVYELAPIHLEQVIAEDLEQKRRGTREARDVLARGIAGWNELHVVLPPERFAQIDQVRADLTTSDEEAAFLVYCALRSTDPGGEQAKYWLGRIAHREQQISAAFVGLFDQDAPVRARAATLLDGYDEPEVRGQLYRTAVEDPEPEVRQAAVAAMRGMQVEEFWEPLARDARLQSSRYRVAAVEALRLFRDTRSVELLKDLVAERETPAEVRAKAIDTLAAMECSEAAEALVDVALHDEDEDDRANASGALASSKTKAVAGVALRAIRKNGGAQHTTESASWGSWFTHWTSEAPRALMTGFGNLLFHGSALISLRRYTAGLALLGAEAGIIAAVVSGRAPSWLLMFLFSTLMVGTWIPMKMLLERRARLHVRLDSFPGMLMLVLYVESIFTIFFLLHGLAHLFAGRIFAAVRIFGLQALALACLGLYFLDEQTYQLTRVGRFYLVVAIILFTATWLWDVIVVALENLIAPERALATERRQGAYACLLANPVAATSMMEFAEGQDARERKWAASVLEQCGDCVSPPLWIEVLKKRGSSTPKFVDRALRHARREETIREVQSLWTGADSSTQDRIFRILARDPSERSLEYLGRLREQLTLGRRLRLYAALLEFRLKLVPGMVWMAALLALPMAVSLCWHGWQYGRRPSRLAIAFVSSQEAQDKEPDRVVKFAKFVAETYPADVDTKVVKGLGRIVHRMDQIRFQTGEATDETTKDRLNSPVLAAQILSQLLASQKDEIRTRAREEMQTDLPLLTRVLSSPDFRSPFDLPNRRIVLGTLETMATPSVSDGKQSPDALAALKRFAIEGSAGLGPDRFEPKFGNAGVSGKSDLQGLQVEAVRILARIPSADAAKALEDLESAPGPMGQEALSQRRQMAPLLLETVRGAYTRSEYEKAVSFADRVLAQPSPNADSKSRAEVLVLRGKSKWRLALTANADPKRADDLDQGAIADLENAKQINNAPLDADTSRVLAACYTRRAERLLPKDLDANMKSNDETVAMAYITEALGADNRYAEAYGTKATLLWKSGDADGAIATLADAVRIDPRYAWAHCMQAWISLKQDKKALAIDYAVNAIDADPDYSWSYTLLGEAHHRDGKDREAITLLNRLHEKYPGNPWPVQTEMYIYHENLAPQGDTSAYEQNYLLYKELQKKIYAPKLKLDDLDAGFAEANLTTGRYDDAVLTGHALLERTKSQPEPRLTIPVRVIVYAALALKGDISKASDELNAFERALRSLPKDYSPEWSFQGTLHYIRASNTAEPLKTSVADLVQAVDKDPLHVPANVLRANRDALKKGR